MLIFSSDGILAESGNLNGPAIRYLEMGRALARRGHEVYLCDPAARRRVSLDGVYIIPRTREQISSLRNRVDVALYNPYTLLAPATSPPLLNEIQKRCPTIADLYDPYLVEVIAAWWGKGWSRTQAGTFVQALASLMWSLRISDYFLVATTSQRLYYLGLLTAAGRVNPAFDIETRIGTVPVGIPRERPMPGPPIIRNVIVPEGDFVFLWPGTLLDWYDGVSPVRALASLVRDFSKVHLIFVGAYSPLWTTGSSEYAKTMRTARELGLMGTKMHVVDWLPYSSRGSMYLECDAAILTYREGLENALSSRSRILDCLWGGLPLILTEGNELADIVRTGSAGLTVGAYDEAAIERGMRALIEDGTSRERMAANALSVASAFSWDKVIEPLHKFCADPSFADDKSDKLVRGTLLRHFGVNHLGIQRHELAAQVLEILRTGSARDLAKRARGYFERFYGLP